MLYTTPSIVFSALALFIAPAFSTITVCWGIENRFAKGLHNVAWIQDLQNSATIENYPVVINEVGTNPCSFEFNIDDTYHSDYQLAGCGGDSMWLTQKSPFSNAGQFVASCSSQPARINFKYPPFDASGTATIDQQYCCS
jgi:hypothetical protein